MRTIIGWVVVLGLTLAIPAAAVAQTSAEQASTTGSGQAAGQGSGRGSGKGTQNEQKEGEQKPESGPKFARALTNVQVELTITDQTGTNPVERKTVSMIVSSGNWGKVRSSGVAVLPRTGNVPVGLNVDARPLVSVDGVIQLELTLVYHPLGNLKTENESPGLRPTEVNQSQTVILQSGKPLTISQAADPVFDRKIVVEVKATVLK